MAVDDGIIDIDSIRQQVEMRERDKYIENHNYEIWFGSNGYYYTYIDKNGKRTQIKRRKQEDLLDAIVSNAKKNESPDIEKVFYEWIDGKLLYEEISKQTYDRYVCDFKRYFSEYKGLKIKLISELKLEKIVKSTIRDFNMTSKAFTNYKTLLKGIFIQGKKCRYTDLSITNFLGDLDISKKSIRKVNVVDSDEVFTFDEIQKIKNHVDNYNSKATKVLDLGILLGLYTGVRVGELAALKYSDLCEGKLSVSRMEIHYKDNDGHEVKEVQEHTKTDAGTREIILTKEAVEIIKELHRINPFGEYLLMKDGKRIYARRFTVRLKKICEQIGIKPRTMHKLRKTYGTNLINGNVDEKLVQSQMGHASITTTRQYYFFNDKDDNEAKRQLENAICY